MQRITLNGASIGIGTNEGDCFKALFMYAENRYGYLFKNAVSTDRKRLLAMQELALESALVAGLIDNHAGVGHKAKKKIVDAFMCGRFENFTLKVNEHTAEEVTETVYVYTWALEKQLLKEPYSFL